MKKTATKLLVSSLIILIFACKKNELPIVDKTPAQEIPPTYTPDSPMWKKLASPINFEYSNGLLRTQSENLYTCVMARPDTLNDHLKVDNFSHIDIMGNIDANTIIAGSYIPENNYWTLQKSEGKPRYSPILIGPLAVFNRVDVLYFSLFGGGYSIDESYPTGIEFFKDRWLRSDFNQSGEIVPNTLLTSFMANNGGYFIENNEKKQLWYISKIQVYEKKKPFSGDFFDKFVMSSAKIKHKDYGFMIAESQDEKIRTKDFYQYDTDLDIWTKKADFPGEDRYEGTMFGVDDKIYYGLGQSKTEAKGFRDIWQYDPQTNQWRNFATYPGSGNIKVATAMVSGKVYIGFGYYIGSTAIKTEKYIGVSDFWQFVPSLK
ncbi:N-acetylneuraminate epimerase [Emticicia aquatica]|uniref:N-acetylneuraminate epimerase n=1 Tax=Emticicia aquatica TaxID=1681835 RepID=A0ABN8EXR0_9BACT|nr:hypothetical protein [Emticicia aquatica]CAH0996930.1 N-acetylneuraminate epimerase [Emticicia aquatica]